MEKRWQTAREILAVRLDGIGDLLMTSPAIRSLAEGIARPRVTLLTSPAGADAARMITGVHDVICYASPWMKATPLRERAATDRRTIRRLRERGFDAAVVFTVFTQSPLPAAMLCYLAEIPLRAAYCRENPYQLLTDWYPETDAMPHPRHEVRRHLDLVASLGFDARPERPLLNLRDSDMATVRHWLCGMGVRSPWLILHPGASAPSRRYPAESFVVAARQLASQHGFRIVVTGDANEAPLCGNVARAIGDHAVNAAGRWTLGEFAALVKLAPLVISNNTSAVHLASALGTPVVDLYALTNPQHTPWNVPHRVLSYDVECRYCLKSVCPAGHHHCLANVPPLDVAQAALELWRDSYPSESHAPNLIDLTN